MDLVMLDIDGTLTQTYEYDLEAFALAIAEVTGRPIQPINLHEFTQSTSSGVTEEAIQRLTGRSPEAGELKEVERQVLRQFDRMTAAAPGSFRPVPGAQAFLNRLRTLPGVGTVIATGGWRLEALYKLNASGLRVDGIPMATSDDDPDRRQIMQIAVRRAAQHHGCPGFERIVSLGDGVWDLRACAELGYGFVGIGSRLQALKELGATRLHPDYLQLEAVLASIDAALQAGKALLPE